MPVEEGREHKTFTISAAYYTKLVPLSFTPPAAHHERLLSRLLIVLFFLYSSVPRISACSEEAKSPNSLLPFRRPPAGPGNVGAGGRAGGAGA